MTVINYTPAPTGLKFHESQDFMKMMMGPFGSGKSVTCVEEIFLQALSIPQCSDGIRRSRWACVRNSYRELMDTTYNTWRQWIPDQISNFREATMTDVLRFNDVECEVLFRALDRPGDVKKLLSLELTGAWLNETREITREVFDAIQGRVGRYPSRGQIAVPFRYGVICDTNPPDVDHYIYELFEELRPEEWTIFHQPSGLAENAENIENLPVGYYQRMMVGKTNQWIDVYVHGKYGFIASGQPVYPEYNDNVHFTLQTVDPIPGVPLLVGCDWGRTPAAVILQHVNEQWIAIKELVTVNTNAKAFGIQLNKILQSPPFRDCPVEGWGDPSGEFPGQTDDVTVFDIMFELKLPVEPAPSQDPSIRHEAVVKEFTRMTHAGKPGLIITAGCPVLRKGMAGGFKYRRLAIPGTTRYAEKPDKNIFSHVCEALEYAFVGAGEHFSIVDRSKVLPFNKPKVKRAA